MRTAKCKRGVWGEGDRKMGKVRDCRFLVFDVIAWLGFLWRGDLEGSDCQGLRLVLNQWSANEASLW